MKLNVTVLILAALMMGIAGCDETLQLEWTDTIGTRGAVWSGIQNRGTLTLINPGAGTIPQETVSAGDAMSFILTSKLELDTTKSKLILTTRGKQYDASLTLIEAPFILPGVRNYRAAFTPENDSPSGVYQISAALWDSAGARPYLTLGKINLTVEGDTTPPVVSGIVVFADSAPVRIGGVVTLLFNANEALDTERTQAIFTIAGGQHEQSVTLVPNTEYQYRTTLSVTDAVPDGTLEEVVVIAQDAAGNSGRFTAAADLTIEKVAPPPPDTTPPVVSNIVVAADSSPIRIGGVVTLSFNANEPLDTERTQAIFTISGGQHERTVTLVPNTEYQYQTTLSVTDAIPDGTLEEVVVIAHDAAGNSGRFTTAADLTIEKVAPPPPDTTPPAITNIVVSADSAPLRVGGVVTLLFTANEPLDTANTQAIFTIAGEQHEQSVTLVPNTEYQYRTTLSVTDAIPDGTLETVAIVAQDPAGNSGRFTGSTNLTVEKVAPPPPDTTPPAITNIAVAADSSPIRVGGVITLSFTANELLDTENTQAIFTISGGQHEQSVTLVPNTDYRYQTTLSVTDAVPDGTLEEVVVIAHDAAGNSGRFTGSTNLTIEKVAPPLSDTTPPAITNIVVSADSAPIRVGGVVTLSFISNEPLDTARTQAIFTIAGEQHAQSVTLIPNTDYRYQTTLSVTDAVPDGTLEEVVVIAHDLAGNSGRFTRSADLTVEKAAPPPLTIAETQARDKLRAWDEERVQVAQRLYPPPTNTPQAIAGVISNGLLGNFTNKFGFEFEKTVLIDLLNLILQEQPMMINQIKQQGIIMHPLSRNGIVYDYLRIQYAYPNAGKEEHLAHFRQLAREGKVRISRDGATDLVPLGQEVVWTSEWFPETAFFTPVEKTEYDLIEVEESIAENLIKFPNTIGIFDRVPTDLILNDLFYYYRLEQPAQAAVVEQQGIIIHPISKNGLLYEWLVLQHRYPDKTEAERMALFRQVARQGSIVVNKPTALTALVPPGDTVVLFPTEASHISPAIRTTEEMLREYDGVMVDSGGGKGYIPYIFQFPDSTMHDLDNSFLQLFKVKIEFVFFNLWNTYKAEQPAQAAAIERQGIIIHPISRNGLLYEWLRLRYDHAAKTEAEWLTLFRQSARNGAIQVNRDGPTDLVPPEGAVYIRPPRENELVNQGLVLP